MSEGSEREGGKGRGGGVRAKEREERKGEGWMREGSEMEGGKGRRKEG